MPTKEATTEIARQPAIVKSGSTDGITFGHPIFSVFNFVTEILFIRSGTY